MSGVRNPWIKFYPSDWRADKSLRICSIAARGLWMEMLCIMHEADPRGHLVVNGVPLTDTQLAMLTGVAPVELGALLTELETAGVFSRTRAGVIYSRRITRDERRRKDGEKTAKNGVFPNSRRGRQVVEKQPQKLPPPRVVRGVANKPPPHPEARSQIPDIEKEEADASSKKKADGCLDKNLTEKPKGRRDGTRAKRGTRLPVDWQPDQEDLLYAGEQGFDRQKSLELADRFRDYWTAKAGQGGVKLDWSATWRNWVRNDIKFHGEPHQQDARRTNTGTRSFVQAAKEVAASIRANQQCGDPLRDWESGWTGDSEYSGHDAPHATRKDGAGIKQAKIIDQSP